MDVALPFLAGWKSAAPLHEFSRAIRVEAAASTLTRLRYSPPLFYPGLLLAFLGACGGLLLLVRPEIVSALLKTRRDEGK